MTVVALHSNVSSPPPSHEEKSLVTQAQILGLPPETENEIVEQHLIQLYRNKYFNHNAKCHEVFCQFVLTNFKTRACVTRVFSLCMSVESGWARAWERG